MKMKELIADYKALHRIPEPGFREEKTSDYIVEVLNRIKGLEICNVADTGVLAFLEGDSRILAFRADMDGLPITESTGLDYSSENKGYMHACGHDAHMAILLELARKRADLKKGPSLLFIFQPAEEGPGGAEPVMQTEFFRKHTPEMIFGLHVHPDVAQGTIGSRKGAFFAGISEFHISMTGACKHAATKSRKNALHGCVSAIDNALEKASMEIKDNYLFHFGRFNSGIRENIIAPDAKTSGTLRALNPDVKVKLKHILEESFKQTASERDLELSLIYEMDYPVLTNHEKAIELLNETAKELNIEFIELDPYVYGEDFSFFLEKIPGAFFILGVGSDKSQGNLHTEDFCFDPEALLTGVQIFDGLIDLY